MKPLRLTVRAFGPYAAEQVFDFGDLRGRSFFLIHGPTGAGKTSVLDAICFALYGEASGKYRAANGSDVLRSDFAEPACETGVTFDFALGEKSYRARRTPEQERPAKRKNKEGVYPLVKQPQEAWLWDRTGVVDVALDGTVVADGWQKVSAEVERLMGFRCEQFRQVVLLPQGQFQELLTCKSDDRRAVLETLFQVHVYGRIERGLKDAWLLVKCALEQARTRRAEVLGIAAAESAEAIAAQLEMTLAELTAAKEAGEALRAARAQAQEKLLAAKEVAAKLKEHDSAGQGLRTWESRAEEFAQKRLVYDRALRAAALVEPEQVVLRLKKEARAEEEKLKQAAAAFERAAAAKALAEAAWKTEEARQGERDAAHSRVTELDGLAAKVRDLVAARQAATVVAKEATNAAKLRDGHRRTLDATRAAVQALERDAERLQRAQAELPNLLAALYTAETTLQRCVRLATLERDLRQAEATATASAGRVAMARGKLGRTREARDRVQDLWDAGQAAILAAKLVEGAACPVCGSIHHPAPAHSEAALPSQADVEKARRVAIEAEAAVAAAQVEASKDGVAIGVLQASVKELTDSFGAQARPDVEMLRTDVARLTASRDAARAAKTEWEKATAKLAGLREAEGKAALQLSDTEAKASAAAATAAAQEAVAVDRGASVPESLRPPEALDREKRAADAKLKQLVDAFDTARKAAQEAEVALASADANRKGLGVSAAERRTLADEQSAAFAEKARAAGFETGEAFVAAKRSPEEVTRLDEQVRDYDSQLVAAKGRLARAAEAAAGLEAPDLAALQATAKEADDAADSNTAKVNELEGKRATAKRTLDRLATLDTELRSLDAEYALLGGVAMVAEGSNAFRMSFKSYVLGAFLDEVLLAATHRLHVMSRGRFLLQRVRDPSSGNTKGGLDLEVHDQHTSTARPASSLSGGESFLASLALALGLADVVQSHAGGIRLETIFVDEGFGTLDPESLDLAIRALQDLQQGGRLVGIISHVTELRELIDARLEVSSGRRGSTARFVVG